MDCLQQACEMRDFADDAALACWRKNCEDIANTIAEEEENFWRLRARHLKSLGNQLAQLEELENKIAEADFAWNSSTLAASALNVDGWTSFPRPCGIYRDHAPPPSLLPATRFCRQLSEPLLSGRGPAARPTVPRLLLGGAVLPPAQPDAVPTRSSIPSVNGIASIPSASNSSAQYAQGDRPKLPYHGMRAVRSTPVLPASRLVIGPPPGSASPPSIARCRRYARRDSLRTDECDEVSCVPSAAFSTHAVDSIDTEPNSLSEAEHDQIGSITSDFMESRRSASCNSDGSSLDSHFDSNCTQVPCAQKPCDGQLVQADPPKVIPADISDGNCAVSDGETDGAFQADDVCRNEEEFRRSASCNSDGSGLDSHFDSNCTQVPCAQNPCDGQLVQADPQKVMPGDLSSSGCAVSDGETDGASQDDDVCRNQDLRDDPDRDLATYLQLNSESAISGVADCADSRHAGDWQERGLVSHLQLNPKSPTPPVADDSDSRSQATTADSVEAGFTPTAELDGTTDQHDGSISQSSQRECEDTLAEARVVLDDVSPEHVEGDDGYDKAFDGSRGDSCSNPLSHICALHTRRPASALLLTPPKTGCITKKSFQSGAATPLSIARPLSSPKTRTKDAPVLPSVFVDAPMGKQRFMSAGSSSISAGDRNEGDGPVLVFPEQMDEFVETGEPTTVATGEGHLTVQATTGSQVERRSATACSTLNIDGHVTSSALWAARQVARERYAQWRAIKDEEIGGTRADLESRE